MSNQKKPNSYTSEFKESAVKLAIESDLPISKTAEELGINQNTLHGWIAKYHTPRKQEVGRVEKEHVYDELKGLRKENKRLNEERGILRKGVRGGGVNSYLFGYIMGVSGRSTCCQRDGEPR